MFLIDYVFSFGQNEINRVKLGFRKHDFMLVFVFDRNEAIAFFDDLNGGAREMISGPELLIPLLAKLNVLKFMPFRLVFFNSCLSPLNCIHLVFPPYWMYGHFWNLTLCKFLTNKMFRHNT